MLDTIELLIDEEDDKPGVFAISLVDEPAIESDFVALSKQKVEMKVHDEDQRIAVGLILIPDKKIYRKDEDGYEYNILFSKDTVKKASELYLKRMRQHNTTEQHKDIITDVFLAQSWIVEDPEMDKINLFGIEAPKGSWAGVMKVENDEVWARVKEGKMLGFSIEGLFDRKPVDKYKEKWDQINKILNG